jgi:hypothetical protein
MDLSRGLGDVYKRQPQGWWFDCLMKLQVCGILAEVERRVGW